MNMQGVDNTAGNTSYGMMMVDMMPSYFQPWNQFEVTLLFWGWDIKQRWQFALTWFAVALAAAIYRMSDCYIQCVKKTLGEFLAQLGAQEIVATEHERIGARTPLTPRRPSGWSSIKILFAVLSASRYSLSLFLMLVAMTFNSSLFLALFVGYAIGEYTICDFELDISMKVKNDLTGNNGRITNLIRLLLLSTFENPVTLISHHMKPSNLLNTDKLNGILWLLPRLISCIFLIVLIYWIKKVEGGFGYEEVSVFGWHALFMSLFIVMCTNEAILTYTAPLLPQIGKISSAKK